MTYHRDEAELGSRVAGGLQEENRNGGAFPAWNWSVWREDTITTRARQALTLAAIRAAEEGDSVEAMQGAFQAAVRLAR